MMMFDSFTNDFDSTIDTYHGSVPSRVKNYQSMVFFYPGRALQIK